jgi:hypothetical protein
MQMEKGAFPRAEVTSSFDVRRIQEQDVHFPCTGLTMQAWTALWRKTQAT